MKFSRFFQFLFFLLALLFIDQTKAQNISVDTSLDAQQLVDKFIGTQNASCITVSNVSISGWNFGGNNPSYGYFTKNGSTFDIEEGIILSTGIAREAEGPNNTLQSNFDRSWGGDDDLIYTLNEAGLPTDNILNATYLEFDFVSLQSDKVSFDYMFLSEEYRDSNCRYSDAFAFLIKEAGTTDPYQNIALVPGTNTPVTSLSINGATNCRSNTDYFGGFNGSVSPTNFNGQTKVLRATATIQKGVNYHIKLVIADHGDANGLYDSAVFLKAGSFTGNIDLGPDLTLENADPLCAGSYHDITTVSGATSYRWFRNGIPIPGTDDIDTYRATQEGDYRVDIVLSSGCKLEGNLRIEDAPVAQVSTSPIMICDDDFNGSFTAKLSQFDSQIIRDYDDNVFDRFYSLTPGGTAIDPDSNFVFSSNPQTIYLSVGAKTCTPDIYPIQFYFGTQLKFNTVQEIDICDDDISGSQTFNLSEYVKVITDETNVTATYFDTEPRAKAGGNSTISNSQTISADAKFFIRIEKAGNCPNYKEIKFKFKQPKKSALLPDDPVIICKGTTIELDAGTGYDVSTNLSFSSYQWYKATEPLVILSNNSKSGNLSPGIYIVELTFNDCVYKQFIKITEAEEPVIDNVLIAGNTATVLVSGGSLPYEFALDNGAYQSSNIFTNVELGAHTVYVKGADGCAVIAQQFTLINSQNLITPNNDGVNDIIDYSTLLKKLEPKFEIYDRNGILIFKGDTSNRFIWNGAFNGKTLPTSSYWYILEWNEAGNPQRVQQNGWILLKNRN